MKEELQALKRTLVVVDMIKGFTEKGALADPYINHINKEVVTLVQQFLESGDDVIAFQDWHTKDAEEFKVFPEHCLAGSKECELIDPLLPFASNMKLIHKNSTSGFVTKEYQAYLKANQTNLKEVVVVGCCTDLCVLDFALPQMNYFQEYNLPVSVIVPQDAVETYHQEGYFAGPHYVKEHKRNDMNARAFHLMEQAGIQLVKTYPKF